MKKTGRRSGGGKHRIESAVPSLSSRGRNARPESGQILQQIATAILTARDAAENLREYLTEGTRLAFLAIRDCERELDQLEYSFDERIPPALTLVSETTARELIASLRFVSDLERIVDLVWWVAKRNQDIRPQLKLDGQEELCAMLKNLSARLRSMHEALTNEDAVLARGVISADRGLDAIRDAIMNRNLVTNSGRKSRPTALEVILMAQALERAGDHVTNLAEELIHLVEKRSVRHSSRKYRDV